VLGQQGRGASGYAEVPLVVQQCRHACKEDRLVQSCANRSPVPVC
jgi:hypothetical protein